MIRKALVPGIEQGHGGVVLRSNSSVHGETGDNGGAGGGRSAGTGRQRQQQAYEQRIARCTGARCPSSGQARGVHGARHEFSRSLWPSRSYRSSSSYDTPPAFAYRYLVLLPYVE